MSCNWPYADPSKTRRKCRTCPWWIQWVMSNCDSQETKSSSGYSREYCGGSERRKLPWENESSSGPTYLMNHSCGLRIFSPLHPFFLPFTRTKKFMTDSFECDAQTCTANCELDFVQQRSHQILSVSSVYSSYERVILQLSLTSKNKWNDMSQGWQYAFVFPSCDQSFR